MLTLTPMRILKAAAAYFTLVFGAGVVLGSIRVPFLVPRVCERTAELVETPVVLVVVIFAACFIVRRFSLPPFWAVRTAVGAIALALLISAEILLAVILQGLPVSQHIASRDSVSRTVYLAALVLVAAMPSILMRFNGPSLTSR